MTGVVSNGVFFNTESGLTPMLDRLTGMLDKRAQNDAQLQGIAPAMRSMGMQVPQQESFLENLMGKFGLGNQQPAPQPAPASAPGPLASASTHIKGQQTPTPAVYRGPSPGFDSAVDRTLGFEGSLNPRDTNGTPSMYGINGAAHPGMDVTKLTKDQARDIYRREYWDGIGADSLPPAMARAAFDTAVIAGPGRAKEFLAAAGDDPQKFMTLREDFQRGLLQSDPQKYGPYGEAWKKRNMGLRMDIAALNAGFDASRLGQQAAPAATGGLQLPGGMTTADLGAMISNPASRPLGIQIWKDALSAKDGYTLKKGETHFDHANRAVASVPDGPVPVSEGTALYDPTSRTEVFRNAHPSFRPATADEKARYGVQPDAPLVFDSNNKPQLLNGGGVNVVNNTGADPIVKAVGDRFDKSLQAAENARKTIASLGVARQDLKSGIFAGAFANEQLGLQKLALALGFPGANLNKITNTESFNSNVGPLVLQTVKGLGAGAGISNADRDAAERMVGSNKLEPAAIERIFAAQERAARAIIADHNALARQLQGTPSGATAYRSVGPAMNVEEPAAAASTKTIGGQTYTKGPDGHWYVGQ